MASTINQVTRWAKITFMDDLVTDERLFTHRPDKGWMWLQRAAFAVLRWIGANHQVPHTEIVLTVITGPAQGRR